MDTAGPALTRRLWALSLASSPPWWQRGSCNFGGRGSLRLREASSWTTIKGEPEILEILSQRSPAWRARWTPRVSVFVKSFFFYQLYIGCVKILNRRGLCDREPTTWTGRLGVDGDGPQWQVLYISPIKRRTADLQWRILQGASNAIISVLNPSRAHFLTLPFLSPS